MNNFQKIIKEICSENNIKYKVLSKDWIIMLEKDNKTRFISGYKFDLNYHGLGLIADDKYALYDVLINKNIKVIEHKILFKNTNKSEYAKGCNSYKYVHDYFNLNNKKIVIKPNSGTCGYDVYKVEDEDEIDNILDKLFTNNHSISICPFYEIENEYRVIILDGEVKLLYAKYLPVVYGDGVSSIRELLFKFNNEYFKDKLDNLKYHRVLLPNEEFMYNWKFNLSQGSIAKKVNDSNLEKELKKMALSVCKEINLGFGSVDIIKTKEGNLLVLEVNSGVMIENYIRFDSNGYSIAKDIYKCAIEKMFK